MFIRRDSRYFSKTVIQIGQEKTIFGSHDDAACFQCFQVIPRNEVIEAMTSGEGETVDFTNKVDVMKPGNVGAVECWLVEVEESMMDILREVTDKSNKAYPSADRVKKLGCAQSISELCSDL